MRAEERAFGLCQCGLLLLKPLEMHRRTGGRSMTLPALVDMSAAGAGQLRSLGAVASRTQ